MAVSAAGLPKWQASKSRATKNLFFCSLFLVDKPILYCRMIAHKGEHKMYHFDDVNDVLNAMADEGILEPMVEPIDDPSVEVNFWDWADIVDIVDEFVPPEYAN